MVVGKISIAALIAALLSLTAHAGIVYTEAVHGELSDDRFNPTDITLEVGVNTLTGTFGPSDVPGVPDRDYVTMILPAGLQLDQLILKVADVGGGFSFIGVERGDILSMPPNSPGPSPLLGWTHFGSSDQGKDLLPGMILLEPIPLQADHYTFWIQELEDWKKFDYSFEYVVSPVPGPSAAAVFVLAFAASASVRRRR